MHKSFLVWAALLGALAVALGAFGAHGLKTRVPAESVQTFQTGVTYHFYHVFALLAVGILYAHIPSDQLVWAGRFFLIGMLLFSGSLYIMGFMNTAENVGLRKLGIVTPFGGLAFIAGWVMMLLGVLKKA